MIAVTSAKPFNRCTDEVWLNQINAHLSWEKVFSEIHDYQRPKKDRPTIKELVDVCRMNPGYSCLINSDIVVHPDLKYFEGILNSRGVLCCLSRRYTLPPDRNLDNAILEPDDLGLDFFCAKQEVWSFIYNVIPPEFKIGVAVWDQWMSNCFVREFYHYCYDITPCRFIFHPKHEGREPQNFTPPKDFYLQWSLWPHKTLTLKDCKIPQTA